MKVEFTHSINCIVTREPGDPKFYTESAFWHALRVHLNATGYDFVKKVMSKDGHMVGSNDYPYYLRDREQRYCIFDDAYALRKVNDVWNMDGRVVLVRADLNPVHSKSAGRSRTAKGH